MSKVEKSGLWMAKHHSVPDIDFNLKNGGMGETLFFTSMGSQGVPGYVFKISTMWPFSKVIQCH